jgi:hypothetical protein
MKCYKCKKPLIWEADFSYEDFGIEAEGQVTILSCLNEECEVETIKLYESYDKSRK